MNTKPSCFRHFEVIKVFEEAGLRPFWRMCNHMFLAATRQLNFGYAF